MSELGQNEGQEQDKNIPFFDSSKISDKKDVEHFSNVEGAEERARKAEQAKKAAEKEAKEVHAADIRAASEQMKKQEQGESGKKGGIVGFLFGGWHKIVTVLMLVALVVGGVLLAINFTGGKTYEEEVKEENEAYTSAVAIDSDLRYPFELDPSPETYEEAKSKYEQSIHEASISEAVFLKIMYACFVYDNENDFNKASGILVGIEKDIKTKETADYYNYRIGDIYERAGMSDDFQSIIVETEKDEN